MKTANQYFEVGDTFIDSDLEIKAECVLYLGSNSCLDCIYDFNKSCTYKNTPQCTDTARKDNTDVIFIKVENDDILRLKEIERL